MQIWTSVLLHRQCVHVQMATFCSHMFECGCRRLSVSLLMRFSKLRNIWDPSGDCRQLQSEKKKYICVCVRVCVYENVKLCLYLCKHLLVGSKSEHSLWKWLKLYGIAGRLIQPAVAKPPYTSMMRWASNVWSYLTVVGRCLIQTEGFLISCINYVNCLFIVFIAVHALGWTKKVLFSHFQTINILHQSAWISK